jgi:dienelactone hydrolase
VSAKIQLPQPSGPLTIGVMDFELTDAGREEGYAPGTHRRVPVRAWYPAVAGNGATRRNAKPAELEHQVVPFLKMIPSQADFSMVMDVPTHAYEDAQPLAGARRPVLVFSHGGFGAPQANTSLMEHLASHGYVVLSISHPYVDSATIHENGDIVTSDPALMADMMKNATTPDYLAAFTSSDPGTRLEAMLTNCDTLLLAKQFLVWEGDFIHVVDRVSRGDLPAKAMPLLDIVDVERIGTFGMSFGCSATAAAQRDERIKATINIDGGIFDADMVDRESRVPMLILHGDLSLMLGGQPCYPHSEFVYENLATAGARDDIIRIEVKGATHIAFTDMALIPAELRADPVLGATVGPIDGQRVISIMNDFCRTFFDHYLRGEGAGIDAAFRADYPEVVDIDVTDVREWAATNPQPGFMSYRHVQIMNRLLAADADSNAATARLDRLHILAYDLANGPKDETVWWQMRFDPAAGISFTLTEPDTPADLTMTGDWREAMQDFAAIRDRKRDASTLRLKPVGDEGMIATTAEAFAAGTKAATIPARMPEV